VTAVILAGAVAGLGVLLLVVALQPPVSRGAGAVSALARLDHDLAARRRSPGTTELRADASRIGTALRGALDRAGLRLPAGLLADLNLIDRPVETHLARSVLILTGSALAGLVLGGLAAAAGGGVPPSAPVWAALIGGLVGGLLPSARVAASASVRRRDFRHVVGSFLDLVALNLSGGRGVPEALQSASRISEGWAMVRIRDTLEMARLQGITPWAALGRLGERTGVDQLRDLAAALELVADDGAKVRESLAARAASLRRRELADAESRAQARSQSMLVAQLLLAVGFLIFLIYPAITRVLST
jgi:tight adherence protein C